MTEYYVLLYSNISDVSAGYSTSILNAMRVALHVSLALSLNLTRNLPAGYTALTLAEGFYLATIGGAEGTYVGGVLHSHHWRGRRCIYVVSVQSVECCF